MMTTLQTSSVTQSTLPSLSDRCAGVLLGTATGDALGWITEFVYSQDTLQERFGVERIEKFYPWKKQVGGRFWGYIDNIAAGSYSDDTQLTIATAACIQSDGSWNVTKFSKEEFPLWLEYARGGGATVKEAAKKIQRKSAQWNHNFFTRRGKERDFDYREAGSNGVVMRVAPHVLANIGNWEAAQADIWHNGIISHGHPRAILGALVYGLALDILLQQEAVIEGQKFIAEVAEKVKQLEIPQSSKIIDWLTEWNKDQKTGFRSTFDQTKQEIITQLRCVWKAISESYSAREVLTDLGAFAPQTKGSGVVTAIAALYLLARNPLQPWENVITTVNLLGSDTDSIAALVGAFGGALYGATFIPEEVQTYLQDKFFLESLGKHLYNISQKKPSSLQIHPDSLRKLKPLTRSEFSPSMSVMHRLRGVGKVMSVDVVPLRRQDATTTLVQVEFEIGQSCLFSFSKNTPSMGLGKLS